MLLPELFLFFVTGQQKNTGHLEKHHVSGIQLPQKNLGLFLFANFLEAAEEQGNSHGIYTPCLTEIETDYFGSHHFRKGLQLFLGSCINVAMQLYVVNILITSYGDSE